MQYFRRLFDRFPYLMRHHNDRDAFAVYKAKNGIHIGGHKRIEPRHGFVENEYLSRTAKSFCQKNALTLSSRQFAERCFFQIGDPEQIHVFVCDSAFFRTEKRTLSEKPETTGKNDLADRCGKIVADDRLLRQIADIPVSYVAIEKDMSAFIIC